MGSRYLEDIQTPYNVEQIVDILSKFEKAENFRQIRYKKREDVLKCGYGIFIAPQWIKFSVEPGMVHVEAWVKYFGERSIETKFIAAAPSAILRAKLDRLRLALQLR